MKLHRLEIEGFGPFRERQAVDIDAFDGDGIFLISGRTGAGKSSILDGVSFALYGGVARYEGGEKRLRSDHCRDGDRTEVRLEFTVAERRWRVTRSPEYQRPARRGGGMTTESARAELEELVDDVWVGRAAKPREVALLLDEVLGLNLQQFQQVILLAQNRFSRFLLAAVGERQQLLRTLFDSRRFEQYRDALDERRRESQHRLDAMSEHARTLLEMAERLVREGEEHAAAGAVADPGTGEPAGAEPASSEPAGARPETSLAARRDDVHHAVQRAALRLETAQRDRARIEEAVTAASAAHGAAVALAKAQEERRRRAERLADLEIAAAEIAADRERLDRAAAAETLRHTLDAVARATQAVAQSERRVELAWAEWRAHSHDADDLPGHSAADLAVFVEKATGNLAVLAAAAAQEARLGDLERQLADARATVARIDEERAALDAERMQTPAELARLDARLVVARGLAATREAAEENHDQLCARRDTARDVEELDRAAQAADRDYAHAADRAAAASAAVSALLRRRLDGYAGELAAGLVDGEPCAVCGSLDHPRPAHRDSEPVTEEAFAAAEHARDETAAAERRASDAAARAHAALAAAHARAGDASPAQLDVRVEEAVAARDAARAAAAEVELISEQRAHALAREEEAERARTALAAEGVTAREQVARLDANVANLTTEIAAARGRYDSVAARIATLTTSRDTARAVVESEAEHERADRALAGAASEARERVAASLFADAAEATAALLDGDTATRLRDRIGEHEAAWTATRQRLADLDAELAGATEDVDVEASAAALAAADAARTAAIAAEGDARHLAERLGDLAARIESAYDELSEQAEQAAAIGRLADTVAGRPPNTMKMDLETFVLAAELEEIVAAANERLAEMSSGRYTLVHSDARAARGAASGLGIEVMDAHTGYQRPPQSLSGGETFLASLALALGLAEVVTARAGGIRLDTLFIDEGFGSLDPDTLDLAMRTLDELRAGGRTVGVISHVEAMKEQLPAQLVVEATAQGPSVIIQPRDAGVS